MLFRVCHHQHALVPFRAYQFHHNRALAAIENILTVGKQLSLNYTIAMHDCGGIDKLEMVQEHVDDGIHEKALHIIQKVRSNVMISEHCTK